MAGNQWEWASSDYQHCPYRSGDGREKNKILVLYVPLAVTGMIQKKKK
jgi:hypothetical protein